MNIISLLYSKKELLKTNERTPQKMYQDLFLFFLNVQIQPEVDIKKQNCYWLIFLLLYNIYSINRITKEKLVQIV